VYLADSQSSASNKTSARQFPFLILILICAVLIVLGASPIVFKWPVAPTLHFFNNSPTWQILGYILLLAVLAGAVTLTGWLDTDKGTARFLRLGGFVLLAASLTDLH
jgi:hypothetical protein